MKYRPVISILNTLKRDTQMCLSHLRAHHSTETKISLAYIRADVYELIQLLLGHRVPRQRKPEEMTI